MFNLIVIAALLVVVTIVVSLATAYDISRQRTRLVAIDKKLLALEDEVEQTASQKKASDDMHDVHLRQRDERISHIRSLMEELARLEQEEAAEREIGVSSGLQKRSADETLE